jgi:hypothetical protein
MKSKRMWWAGYTARMEKMIHTHTHTHELLVRKPEGRDHSEDLEVGGRTVLE